MSLLDYLKIKVLVAKLYLVLFYVGQCASVVLSFLSPMIGNTYGGVGGLSNMIIGIAVAGLVASFILPIAISNLFSANTTGWSTDATNMWAILPVVAVLVVVIAFVGYVRTRR
jgi:hypothetical protein